LPDAEEDLTFLGEDDGTNNEKLVSGADADKEFHVHSVSKWGNVKDVTALHVVEGTAKSPFLAIDFTIHFTRWISDFPEASFPKVKYVSDKHGKPGMLIET
jgi:hypothetical protein